jgi:hypothetical protein
MTRSTGESRADQSGSLPVRDQGDLPPHRDERAPYPDRNRGGSIFEARRGEAWAVEEMVQRIRVCARQICALAPPSARDRPPGPLEWEDLAQETARGFFEIGIHQFLGGTSEMAYLYTLTKATCLRMNRGIRSPEEAGSTLTEEGGMELHLLADRIILLAERAATPSREEERHLADCAGCRSELDWAERLPPEPPPYGPPPLIRTAGRISWIRRTVPWTPAPLWIGLSLLALILLAILLIRLFS